MKPEVVLTAGELLGAMHMHVTVRVPRRTLWVVRARLWLATGLVRLAALVGGCSVSCEPEAPDNAQGEGG